MGNEEGCGMGLEPATSIDELAPTARAALCMDFGSGEVWCERQGDLVLPVASMAKVMSAYLVLDEMGAGALDPDGLVTASARAAAVSCDTEFSGYERFVAGGRYRVETLLQLALVASGNGSMIALAEAVAGSEEAFVARMNPKARELGIDARFASCCGIDAAGDVASPRAMASLARQIVRDHPRVLGYTSLCSVEFQGEGYVSTNRLLTGGFLEGVDGLKTGTTPAAGCCFVGTASRGGRRVISVVMHADTPDACMTESKNLLEYGFACSGAFSRTATMDCCRLSVA